VIAAAFADARADMPQQPRLTFQRVAQDTMLNEIETSGIVQDQQGFLWVAAPAGLFKYDGYRTTYYTHDSDNPNSLTRNEAFWLFCDREGRLWVGLDGGGLERYDPSIDGFIHYKHDPNDSTSISHNTIRGIWQDANGMIWVGTRQGGLDRLDPATGKFIRFCHDDNDPDSIASDNVYRGFQDRSGRHWVGTAGGLDILDPVTGKFQHVIPKNEMRTPAGAVIYDVVEDKSGTVWAGTLDGTIFAIDEATLAVKVFRYSPEDAGSPGGSQVAIILVDSRDTVWFGYYNNPRSIGLDRYDRTTGKFIHSKADFTDPNALPDDSVNAFFEDRTGRIWIGTHNGLCKYDRKAANFLTSYEPFDIEPQRLNQIRSISETSDGILWFGMADGLITYDPKTNLRREYKHDPKDASSIASGAVSTIFQRNNGDIWISTEDGYYCLMDKQRRGFKTYAIKDKEGRDMEVWGAADMPDGRLIVTNWLGGFHVLNTTTDKFEPYLNKVPVELWTGSSRATVTGPDGKIYFGMRFNGLAVFDPVSGDWRQYKHNDQDPTGISDDQVFAAKADDKGNIWIGTSNGVNRFDPTTGTFKRYTTTDGLSNNSIRSLVIAPNGIIWIGTLHGLNSIDPANGTIKSYTVADGLPGNRFFDPVACASSWGEMFFVTSRGLVHFYPAEIESVGSDVDLVITGVRIFEKPVKFGRAVETIKDFDFTWHDGLFAFDFAALGLHSPQAAKYAWKMDGYDQDWIYGQERSAAYTNLPGGSYVFRVKVMDEIGVWSERELAVNVTVSSPPWKRWWAYLSYLFIAIIAAMMLIRFREKRIRKENVRRAQFTQDLIRSQEAERKRIASELHDGLGQSLVVIKNRAVLGLTKGDDRSRVERELKSISDSASNALEEVREITNNLRPQLLDRLGLTKAITSMIKKLAGMVDVTSEVDHIDLLFDENEEIGLYRIIQESLNNVLKHAGATHVTVRIKRGENRVTVRIEDNGKGFDTTGLSRTRLGLGLVGLQERATLLKGELTITSTVGGGTVVEVKVPMPRD